jgi:hypothetical protein
MLYTPYSSISVQVDNSAILEHTLALACVTSGSSNSGDFETLDPDTEDDILAITAGYNKM